MSLQHLFFALGLAALAPAFSPLPLRAAEAHSHRVYYQCPMHPQIIRDQPGECPICHMQLQRVEEAEEAPSAKGAAPASAKAPAAPAAPEGHAAFSLPAERRQLIGVRSTEALRRKVTKSLRLPGRMGDGRWVQAQALEMDGALLKQGLRASVVLRGAASKRAVLSQVDRGLDAYSRTYGVSLSLTEAPDPLMRPGVYVDVRVELDLGSGVAVPKEAVMDTGEDQWVFVEKGEGRFEPRSVQLGAEGDALVVLRKGVAEGERVVTSANFLIDSESRFRAAAQGFGGQGAEARP